MDKLYRRDHAFLTIEFHFREYGSFGRVSNKFQKLLAIIFVTFNSLPIMGVPIQYLPTSNARSFRS